MLARPTTKTPGLRGSAEVGVGGFGGPGGQESGACSIFNKRRCKSIGVYAQNSCEFIRFGAGWVALRRQTAAREA